LKSLAAGDNSKPLLGDFELDDALRSIESGNFESWTDQILKIIISSLVKLILQVIRRKIH